MLLLEGGPRLLPSYPESLSAQAKQKLRRLGVEVRTETLVTDIRPGSVIAAGWTIPTQTVIWAAGNTASPVLRVLRAPLDRMGRALVEPDCTIPGHPEVFVLGDAAAFEHQPGGTLPGICPVAIQMGEYAARTIAGDLAGRPRRAFSYWDKGQLAVIGRGQAVADIWRLHFGGFLAWLIWIFVHVFFLIGFRNRVLVLLQWGWSYITYSRGARLITGETQAPAARPFLPSGFPPPRRDAGRRAQGPGRRARLPGLRHRRAGTVAPRRPAGCLAGQGLRRHDALPPPAGEAAEKPPTQRARGARGRRPAGELLRAGHGGGPDGAAGRQVRPGGDYHRVTRARIDQLGRWLLDRGARVAHSYVDDGPVPERALAHRAGLGWIGKNTMLIRPGAGSFCFIGTIFTDLPLPPDAPMTTEHCGSCTRCLDACPTGALVEPYMLDATRCISYLTIEQKGAIPPALAARLDGWAFGCDVCNDVCPWNERFATTTPVAELLPRRSLDAADAELFETMDDDEFRRRYGGTPFARPGLAGMRRNLRAALASASPEE